MDRKNREKKKGVGGPMHRDGFGRYPRSVRPFARMRVVVVEWLGVGIHWRCLVSLKP